METLLKLAESIKNDMSKTAAMCTGKLNFSICYISKVKKNKKMISFYINELLSNFVTYHIKTWQAYYNPWQFYVIICK